LRVVTIHWANTVLPKGFPAESPGGAENAVWEIARRLSKENEVSIISAGYAPATREVEGVRLIWIPVSRAVRSKWIRPDAYYSQAAKLAIAHGAEVVHLVNCIEPALWLGNRTRTVLNMHNELALYPPYPKPKEKFYSKYLGNIDAAVGVSAYICKSFLRSFSQAGIPCFRVFNGADFSVFKPEKRDQRFLEALGIDDSDFVLYWGGRIIRRKGLHLAIEVVDRLNARLLVTGIGDPNLPYYSSILRKIDNDPRVVFLGNVPLDTRAKAMASSDAVLCPSIWQDPSPLICYEGQACGRPVIGTRVGGVPELIEHSRTGLLSSPHADSLSRWAEMLMSNPSLSRRLGKHAHARARTWFDWDKVAEQFQHIYSMDEDHLNDLAGASPSSYANLPMKK